MYIKKILIKNYKIFENLVFDVNKDFNIFVGENDSGKSSILEAIEILSTGKLNGCLFSKQIKANLFNYNVRREYIESLSDIKSLKIPPKIIIEAYFESDEAEYQGSENELCDNCTGIRVNVEINQENSVIYKKLLIAGEIYDIPVELYTVSYHYFNGDPVAFRFGPLKTFFIDTTRKDYSNVVDRFVSENITTYLNPQEQLDLSTAYRKCRNDFHQNEIVNSLNESVKKFVHIANKSLTLDLKEENSEEWKKQMSVVVDDIPFENIGFGSQNTIKIELALKNSENQSNLVLMEEPENNLSFSNLSKLVQHVEESKGKQVFITTHSSYVVNKLNLNNILLVNNGIVNSFSSITPETVNYFRKLPGYNTLRIILSSKSILVEGPTDELIIQRAYKDEYNRLPSEDGVDIIVVDSLAFKRYCEIAELLHKKIIIVTDNDSNIQKNINKKYSEYIDSEYVDFVYETNECLNTIEPSVLEVNCIDGVPTEKFKLAISKNNSQIDKSKSEILNYMLNNKTEWAIRVFDFEDKINYPEYIKNAIKKCR